MHMHPITQTPPLQTICLCRGDSYDAKTHDGYLLAYQIQTENGPQWVSGKQQFDVQIEEWISLEELQLAQRLGARWQSVEQPPPTTGLSTEYLVQLEDGSHVVAAWMNIGGWDFQPDSPIKQWRIIN